MPATTKSAAFNVRVDPLLKREVVALTEALGGNPSAIVVRALEQIVREKSAELARDIPAAKAHLAAVAALFLKATTENKESLALSDFESDDEPGRAYLAAYLADWKEQDDAAPDALDVTTIEDEMRYARSTLRRLSAAASVVMECRKARAEQEAAAAAELKAAEERARQRREQADASRQTGRRKPALRIVDTTDTTPAA